MTTLAVFRQQFATQKVWAASGGDAAITMDSIVNAAGREGAKLDFGAMIGELLGLFASCEFATAPTAGLSVDFYMNWSSSGTAGTDNLGGASGTDAAYAGYSANLAASVKQLDFLGSLILTAQATATVQKGLVGLFRPKRRYGSPIVVNSSAVSWVSNSTNTAFYIGPIEGLASDS